MVWLKNHISYANEKEDYFLRTLDDPVLKNFTEKLRKHKEANISNDILAKYREAMWDYVCEHGGTVALGQKQIAIPRLSRQLSTSEILTRRMSCWLTCSIETMHCLIVILLGPSPKFIVELCAIVEVASLDSLETGKGP